VRGGIIHTSKIQQSIFTFPKSHIQKNKNMGLIPVNKDQLELMRKSGVISAKALKKALETAQVGVSELELDKAAGDEIYKRGGDWSYKTVPDYHWATCVTVNQEVVHGIPKERKIQNGDLVSVDLAAMYKGWHTDNAWTILVGQETSDKSQEWEEKKRFLQVGEEALFLGIKQAVAGKRVGDISAAIQKKVEGAGYHVVRALVGHGVGREMHEEPEVPGYGRPGTGPVLKEGMTLAIEVIYAAGTSEVVIADDNWTYESEDGSMSGLFEMSIVVGKKKAEILTDWRNV
jgi:methionyl aminopeptidase